MSSIGTGYDLSAGTFSPQGRIFQVEYSYKAVENSGTAIGIRCKDGVVFAVETIVTSKLYEPRASRRLFHIDTHIGMNVAGLLADAKHLVEIARDECSHHKTTYNAPITLKLLVERLAQYMHAYTLTGAMRPFGCCVMLSSYTPHEGPELYMIEPSGLYYGYHGCAIGKAKQNAQTEIEKIKFDEITCRELVKEAAKIIYQVHDEIKDKHFELDMTWVGAETGGIHQDLPNELFQEVEEYAKLSLTEDDEMD